MIPTKTIQLDFWRHPTDILHLVQGEADGRKVEFKIFDNGSAFDLTGYTVQMAVKKPDGNIVVNSGTITDAANGVCEVTITSQVVSVVGNLHAELQILKEGQLSKSFRIVTKVAAGVDAEGIAPSVTEFGVLTDLITDVNTVLAIADTDLWPEVVANAQYFSDLAGAGRMTETVKANADEIAAVEAEIETARDGAASLGDALGLKADKAQEAWITPTLVNGWQHHSIPLQYMKDNFGFVHFRGGVKGGTSFKSICSLPLGYTPESAVIVRVFKFTSSLSAMESLSCRVTSAPSTGLYSYQDANGASDYLLFDGIYFKAV